MGPTVEFLFWEHNEPTAQQLPQLREEEEPLPSQMVVLLLVHFYVGGTQPFNWDLGVLYGESNPHNACPLRCLLPHIPFSLPTASNCNTLLSLAILFFVNHLF